MDTLRPKEKTPTQEVIAIIKDASHGFKLVKGEILELFAGSGSNDHFEDVLKGYDDMKLGRSVKFELESTFSSYAPSEDEIEIWIQEKGGDDFLRKLIEDGGSKGIGKGLSLYEYKRHKSKTRAIAKRLRSQLEVIPIYTKNALLVARKGKVLKYKKIGEDVLAYKTRGRGEYYDYEGNRVTEKGERRRGRRSSIIGKEITLTGQ
ncbi:hypothetical protein HOE67_02860 [Candidatus Peregrinibacteria bacterium]|jgi:hypothetical protein|nr:hypothetical protein [Candidatus Peregrinibacteria bacterium]MBT4056027.1 hypothetical protein [Candidatus Peregrinibacteria bacterium]